MIQSALLSAIANVRHGFFTREGGHSNGVYASLNCGFGSKDDETAVRRNRELVAAQLGVGGDDLLTVWQSHSPDVKMVEAAWDVRHPPEADAMVTRRPGIALGVLSADCTPILFADRDGRAVGVAHAGWKGAIGGVLEETVAAFGAQGVGASDIAAVIGPTISQPNYEVGSEFFDRFVSDDAVRISALRAGAIGFLLKHTPPAEILRAIARVAAGEPILSPTVTRQLIAHLSDTGAAARQRHATTALDQLSGREREVAIAVGRGKSNAEIAGELFMSVATVKAHISRILAKLDLNNRTQVALLAHDAGLTG